MSMDIITTINKLFASFLYKLLVDYLLCMSMIHVVPIIIIVVVVVVVL
jgi:hypothetical protein